MVEKFLMNFFGNKQVKKAARENGLSSRNSNTFFFHIVFMINVMLFWPYCKLDHCEVTELFCHSDLCWQASLFS